MNRVTDRVTPTSFEQSRKDRGEKEDQFRGICILVSVQFLVNAFSVLSSFHGIL